MNNKEAIIPKQLIYLLFVCVTLSVVFAYLPQQGLPPFTSAEVHFYDPSTHGLKIMPASCASSASWYHSALTATGDGYGYKIANGVTEAGGLFAGVYVCVTNASGNTVFVPAKTANEINQFKAHPPTGVSAW